MGQIIRSHNDLDADLKKRGRDIRKAELKKMASDPSLSKTAKKKIVSEIKKLSGA